MKNIKNKKRKPFLFIGLGLVIATFVFAKGPFDVATSPGQPRTTRVWCNGCELMFGQPADDGGTPIIRYIVEARSAVSGEWERCSFEHQPKADDNGNIHGSVAGMQEGIQVVFRAKAVNKAGIGAPSDQSSPVLFKD